MNNLPCSTIFSRIKSQCLTILMHLLIFIFIFPQAIKAASINESSSNIKSTFYHYYSPSCKSVDIHGFKNLKAALSWVENKYVPQGKLFQGIGYILVPANPSEEIGLPLCNDVVLPTTVNIEFQPGWNLVSNPFDEDLLIQDIKPEKIYLLSNISLSSC